MLSDIIPTIAQLFAAAGGGGSSSSDDGGNIIALIGYFPSYYLGKLIKKFLPRRAELIVSVIGATISSAALLAFSIYAGGGIFFMALIVAGIWAGWYAAFFNAFDKLHKKFKHSKVAIATASQTDSTWNGSAIEEHVRNIFLRFETDWSSFNTSSIATYTTSSYNIHIYLMLACLRQLGRTNIVKSPTISELGIIDVVDSPDNTEDRFTAVISWRADDLVTETATNKVLWKNKHEVVEYWHFRRNENSYWLLDGISQETAAAHLRHSGLVEFATANGMFYSLDMGELFIPYYGVLFNQKSKKGKDVNNHVVGAYNQRLIQLYTFSYLEGSGNHKDHHMVAQVQLPKSYGGILVESVKSKRGKRLFGLIKNSAPKNYTPHSFEWQDFNNRYRVYATDSDRLATFELINPGFMAWLHDNDPEVSIEVANNIVYLYKPIASVKVGDYEKFMTIIQKAFKELQL